ncbi:hypothetical protein [Sphingomonas sp. Leaf21]|uniref:hypothetical protein n=1 Tax=Sphingomonas sp. Leaf21 TaxID=2876550 RepID=UPI001E6509FF|nr:hypothetical protein [Sphingomonas sp. Leaf21]
MKRRSRRIFESGRSRVEWTVRGTLAAVALLAGCATASWSFADAVSRQNPKLANILSPWDGRITAWHASELFKAAPSPDPQSPAARLAQTALRQDPTAVAAINVLGLQAQLQGNVDKARRLFAYSQFLSRRDLATQLWAVEDAVSRGNVASALRHYDTALRTSKSASALLFPVLSSAMTDPAIRGSLIATLAKKPAWTGNFIAYLVDNNTNAEATAHLFAGLRSAQVPISAEADAAVVKGLIDSNAIDDAWRYYATARKGADRRRSRDAGFDANLSTPSLFDWTAGRDPTLAASLQRSEKGGIFAFATTPGAGGVLLQQTQLLPPGDYRLDGHSSFLEQPEQTSPYWVLSCQDGRELGKVVVTNSRESNGHFSGRLRVPAECPVQTLYLIARPSEAAAGVVGQIDHVLLSPTDGAIASKGWSTMTNPPEKTR